MFCTVSHEADANQNHSGTPLLIYQPSININSIKEKECKKDGRKERKGKNKGERGREKERRKER